jgi:hypothetical protein
MESSNEKLQNCKKQPHDAFKFFINLNDTENSYLHNFLGSPTVLQIGKYSNEAYDLAPIDGLITLKLSHKVNSDSQTYTHNNIPFNLPEKVTSILTNLDIDEINKTKSQFYATEFINFYWVIVNNTLDKKNTDSSVLNIVPHTFLFSDIDFSKTKRMVRNTPICLIPADDSGAVVRFKNNNPHAKFNTDVSFDKLRVEYSSMHLIKGCLGFSPNNLKFVIKKGKDMVDFYVVMLDELGIANSVFYYWLWERDDISISDVLGNSYTIEELLESLQNILGENNCLMNMRNMFFI